MVLAASLMATCSGFSKFSGANLNENYEISFQFDNPDDRFYTSNYQVRGN